MNASTAVTASPVSPTTVVLLMVAALVVWCGGYVIACRWFPFADCQKCKGTGKRRSPSGKAFGNCRRCKGKARRLRTGRRVFNYLHVTRKEATKE